MSVSLCLSVCGHISSCMFTPPYLFCMLPMTVARSSSFSIAVRYVLPILWVLTTGVDRGGPSPPNGRAEKKGRGYFYNNQMSNMYTCIAYLIEIWKFCSKNLVHKGVNLEAQNALKLTYEQWLKWGGAQPPCFDFGGVCPHLLESEPSLPTAGPKLLNSTKNHNVRCRINKF